VNAVSGINLTSRVIALCLFALTLPATAASPDENTVSISFTTVEHYLVVVPVSINGAGPFNFLLDTGATNSDIDPELADQLSLPAAGEHEVIGIERKVHLSIVHAQSISVAGRAVRNLNLNVVSRANGLPSKVSGILGEDFLSNFDLLIDNRHHVIQLQQGLGSMSDMFEGERLPVQLEVTVNGQYVNHTLVVTGFSNDLGRRSISLLLDSGVNYLYLFGGKQSLGGGATQRECSRATLSDPSKQFLCLQKVLPELCFGKKQVVSLMAVAQLATTNGYTDGLMPTSAFHSIFISHSQRFVILDPSSSKPRPAGRGM
jgi:predicted aspartyl protease